MSFRPPSAHLEPSSPSERRSFVVFSGFLLMVLLAVTFPGMAPQGLQGILWMGAGLLMIALPPEVRVPRLWILLAMGFVVASLAGFLPRTWMHVSPWRLEVEALGPDTGSRVFVQPQLAAEYWAGLTMTALVVPFLLGHRIGGRQLFHLALAFALAVAVWVIVALCLRQPYREFGLFPNRNHTSTLLAMGALVGSGCFANALRQKSVWKIALSAVATCLCICPLLMVSESRAGILLLAVGLVAWLPSLGIRSLRGHTGKAMILFLIGVVGMILVVDSRAKNRMAKAMEHFEAPAETIGAPRLSFNEAPAVAEDPHFDGRVSIYQDTWAMIRHEPWTGVGPGQFAQVFPQYRKKTDAPNDSRCLHPESDWLMVLAENGWPAALCLAAAVVSVFFVALKQAWSGRGRSLRMGCLVAALLLCLHGIFDVPGHHVGLAWAAALLVGISLRSRAESGKSTDRRVSYASRICWRSLGLVPLLAGIWLFQGQCRDQPVLPSARVQRLENESQALYVADREDFERATAEGRNYQPSPSEDMLEIALKRMEEAIRITPLDPNLHYARGVLALNYDDKQAIAEQAFAIQSKLEPTRIKVALDQAQAWMNLDPQRTQALWVEALRRAAVVEARFPGNFYGTANTYRNVVQAAGKDESFSAAALKLAGDAPGLLVIWAQYAPIPLVDRELPRLILAQAATDDRDKLFQTWKTRGSKEAVALFVRSHPEFDSPPAVGK